MPEGDTVYRAAAALHAAMAGKVLTRCDIRVPRYATVDLSGRVVDEVLPRGKHLLMRVGDATIHSHLKMEGAWHIHRPGQRWRRPAFAARAVLGVQDPSVQDPSVQDPSGGLEVVGFDLGILEILDRGAEAGAVGHLGPDLLGPDWDAERAAANLAREPDRPIGAALLDQSVLAGIGNIYRSELCFLRGRHPATPVSEVGDPLRWSRLARRLLEFNKDRVTRVTTGDRRDPLWVYGRGGRPCRRCGTVVRESMHGDPARVLFWCPHCQPGSAAL